MATPEDPPTRTPPESPSQPVEKKSLESIIDRYEQLSDTAKERREKRKGMIFKKGEEPETPNPKTQEEITKIEKDYLSVLKTSYLEIEEKPKEEEKEAYKDMIRDDYSKIAKETAEKHNK